MAHDVPTSLDVAPQIDGFSVVLPPHWLAAALLPALHSLTTALGIVAGGTAFATIAGMICGLGVSAGLHVVLPGAVMSIVVSSFLVGMFVQGGIWGHHLALRVFGWLRAQRRQVLRVQGHQLFLGAQRISLADVVGVEARSRSVVLVMHSGRQRRLCSPSSAAVQQWLVLAIREILVRQTAGSPKDIPATMHTLRQPEPVTGRSTPPRSADPATITRK